MALILPKKESAFQEWYRKNKQRISEKRKQRYQEDPEYRQRALEASRRRKRGESALSKPSDAQISFGQAAQRVGISVSTLHEWRRKKYLPEPKHHGGRLWFNEKQVLLLKNLREFLSKYGKRRWSAKLERLKGVVASIATNWD